MAQRVQHLQGPRHTCYKSTMARHRDPVAQAFRERLRSTRPADLARQAGVSRQYINDLKQGRRPFGPKILAFLGFEKVVTVARKESA